MTNNIATKLIALDQAARMAEKNGLTSALTAKIDGHDVTAKAVWTETAAHHTGMYRTYWALDGKRVSYRNLRDRLAQSIAEATA